MKSRILCVVVAASVSISAAWGQGPPDPRSGASVPVQILNTSENPVPVAGDVTVTGTADVNVTNSSIPVTQSGAWTVGLSGTPEVTVTNELSVSDADNPAFQPVRIEYEIRFGSALISNGETLRLYEVPAGKRLVIEYIDGRFIFDPVSNAAKAYWSLSIFDPVAVSSTEHPVATASESAPCSLAQSCLAISRPVRIYADPGASLKMFLGYSLTQASSNTLTRGTINGHLVDVQ